MLDTLLLAISGLQIANGLIWVLFLGVSLLLILTILIQKPQGGGLAGAFGSGAGSGQTAFGAKTGDMLTIMTVSIFVIWLLGAVALNYWLKPAVAAPVVPGVVAPGTNQAPATGTTPAGASPGATTPAPAPAGAIPGTTPGTTPPAPAGTQPATGTTPPTTTPAPAPGGQPTPTTPPSTPPAAPPANPPATPPSGPGR